MHGSSKHSDSNMESQNHIKTLMDILGAVNKTTLLAYSNSEQTTTDDILNQLDLHTHEVLIYDISTLVTINAALLIEIVILLISNVLEANTFFQNWYKYRNFNYNAKYLIFYLSSTEIDMVDINAVAAAAWHAYAHRLIIFDKNMQPYVQNNLASNNCNLNNTKKINFNRKQIINVYKREYKQFYGCPFTVLTTTNIEPYIINIRSPVYKGLEPKYIELIAEKMNFTLVYVNHNYTSWGEFLNGEITCCMFAGLQRREADMMFGMVVSMEGMNRYFDTSISLLLMDLRFCIPKAQRQLPWLDITRVFDQYTWKLYVGSLIIFALIYFIIGEYCCSGNGAVVEKVSKSYLNVISIAVARSVKLPRNLIQRILILSWIIPAFLLSSLYEATFLSFLLHPTFQKQIKTNEDIVSSGYSVYGTRQSKYLFSFTNDQASKIITARWQSIELSELLDRTEDVIKRRNMVTAASNLRMRYAMSLGRRFVDENHQSKLYISSSIVSLYLITLMQRGLPIKIRYNRMVKAIGESGLLQHYERNITFSKDKLIYGKKYFPIAVENILVAFTIYFGGISIAIVVFLVERMVNKRIK